MAKLFKSNARLGTTLNPIDATTGPEHVVLADTPECNFLLINAGGTMDLDEAERFGLIGGPYDADAPKAQPAPPAQKPKSTPAKKESAESVSANSGAGETKASE